MLIGLTGPAGSGKDTVADLLVDKFSDDRRWSKLSMAGSLKQGLAAMGFPEPEDRSKKEERIAGFDFSWREAAQRLGTEWGRALDQDIWVKIAQQRIKREIDAGFFVVVSDIRFDNEAAMILSLGGYVVQVQGRKADLKGAEEHVSENGINSLYLHYRLDNSNSKLMLISRTAQMLEHIQGRRTNA